jgi:hypothetical protein
LAGLVDLLSQVQLDQLDSLADLAELALGYSLARIALARSRCSRDR